MKKIKWILLTTFWIGMASTVFSAEALGKFKFNEIQKQNKYYSVFQEWAAQDEMRSPGGDAVLCLGSSSMRKWAGIHEDLAPLNVIHRGFGGSTIAQVREWENFFIRYKAGTIVIYEGDNDLVSPSSSPKKFSLKCGLFCDALLQANPQAEIYFVSIKPSAARMAAWPRMSRGNQLLKQYATDTPQIHFIEASSPMLDDQGQARTDILLDDNLHMNQDGYKIWTAAVRKALDLKK